MDRLRTNTDEDNPLLKAVSTPSAMADPGPSRKVPHSQPSSFSHQDVRLFTNHDIEPAEDEDAESCHYSTPPPPHGPIIGSHTPTYYGSSRWSQRPTELLG